MLGDSPPPASAFDSAQLPPRRLALLLDGPAAGQRQLIRAHPPQLEIRLRRPEEAEEAFDPILRPQPAEISYRRVWADLDSIWALYRFQGATG